MKQNKGDKEMKKIDKLEAAIKKAERKVAEAYKENDRVEAEYWEGEFMDLEEEMKAYWDSKE